MRDIRCGVRESGEPGEDGTDDGTDDKPSDQTRPVLELELIKAGTRVSWCEKWIQNGKDRDAEPVLKDKCNQWMGKKIISLGNELTKLQDQIMVEQKEGKTYEQWSITMKKTIPMYRHYHRLLKLVYVSTEFGLESMYRAQLAIAMHLYDLGEGDDEDDKFYMHSVKESITNIAKIRNLNTSQAQKLGFVKMMELSEATFIKDGNRYWTDRLTRFCSRSSYSFEYFYEDHKVCEYPKTLSNLPMHLRHHVSDPPVVEATLQRHKGKETQMFSKLVQTYESGSDTDADSIHVSRSNPGFIQCVLSQGDMSMGITLKRFPYPMDGCLIDSVVKGSVSDQAGLSKGMSLMKVGNHRGGKDGTELAFYEIRDLLKKRPQITYWQKPSAAWMKQPYTCRDHMDTHTDCISV